MTNRYDPSTEMANGLGLTPHGGSQVWLLAGLVYSGQAGAAGLPASASLGAITGGTGSVAYAYDGLLRPTSTKYTLGSATLYQVQPTYDPLGNVTGETTTLPQGVDTQVFCYDAQDRLTWAGSTGTLPCSSGLTPGDTGSLAGTGASYSATYAYDAANRLTSSPLGSYTYGDAAHVDAATQIGAGDGECGRGPTEPAAPRSTGCGCTEQWPDATKICEKSSANWLDCHTGRRYT